MTDECEFCGIVEGRHPASGVFEDEVVVAFLDTLPINCGHTLVIPRRHSACLAELSPDEGAQLFISGQRIAAALRASDLPCDGVNLLLNDGSQAGQRVFHTHLHVIPRIAGDSLRRNREGPLTPRDELDSVAKALRQAVP
jgi:diadenosine tetraphosphate (Ap4A) HIT family hydrolase